MNGKPVRESCVEKIEQVMPGDTNTLGTVFGGKVMQWIDMTGAISAIRHVRKPVVTASIDRINFYAPARIGHFLVFKSQVNFTGSSSMEIGVTVHAEDPMTGERFLTTNALLTFVAIDQNGKPVKVPPILPETEEEKKRFEEGRLRREGRLKSLAAKK